MFKPKFADRFDLVKKAKVSLEKSDALMIIPEESEEQDLSIRPSRLVSLSEEGREELLRSAFTAVQSKRFPW